MPQMRHSIGSRLLSGFFRGLNRIVAWHRLPGIFGAINLLAFREDLRERNLHSTSEEVIPALPDQLPTVDTSPANRADHACRRSSDGTFNDEHDPRMGCAFARFGRNFPLDRVYPEPFPGLMEPSPRLISRRLLARRPDPANPERDKVIEATSLNLLAAAWIQFMTHDWFHHGDPVKDRCFTIRLDPDDDWRDKDGHKLTEMTIRCTPPDPTRPSGDAGYPSAWVVGKSPNRRSPDGPPTYLNHGSHWWDGSQIYGENDAQTSELRCPDLDEQGRDTRGELRLTDTRHLLTDPNTHLVKTGFSDNWWVGLSILHTLFAQEHNAIAGALRREYPYWSNDRIFHTARLVNTALMAKIHTVEWTPAILGHPALAIGMNANWWGLLGEHFTRAFGRVGDGETLSGIMGSPTDHHSAPFALTEEFVSVYRLHPLLPDSLRFYRVSDGQRVTLHLPRTGEMAQDVPLEQAIGRFAQMLLAQVDETTERTQAEQRQAKLSRGEELPPLTLADACYSFGIAHPGAITLHNYPNFLRRLERIDKTKGDGTTVDEIIDLAAIDVMRDRERGVPRYNDFRVMLRKPRVRSFSEITSNEAWAAELREVYRDVDRVDLLVGMLAEDLPKGFGFSDTAFRIFILMASRRLKSDRFFTTDYTPEVYTRRGLDWINENTMKTVLIRHFPQVAPALRRVKNAFAPWDRIDGAREAP